MGVIAYRKSRGDLPTVMASMKLRWQVKKRLDGTQASVETTRVWGRSSSRCGCVGSRGSPVCRSARREDGEDAATPGERERERLGQKESDLNGEEDGAGSRSEPMAGAHRQRRAVARQQVEATTVERPRSCAWEATQAPLGFFSFCLIILLYFL